MIVRELIVDIDDAAHRVTYAAVGGRTAHHDASMQVFGEGEQCSRLVWIADLLPNEAAAAIGGMIEQGAAAMQRTLATNGENQTVGTRDR